MSATAVLEQHTEATLPAMAKIDAYDFGVIAERVRKDGVVAQADIDSAVGEFRKYLKLIAMGNSGLVMCSEAVDEVWHTFILHTRDYVAFCNEVFGRYLHHQPHNEFHPSVPGASLKFAALYNANFGELHPLWNVKVDPCEDDPGNCNDEGCKTCVGGGQE